MTPRLRPILLSTMLALGSTAFAADAAKPDFIAVMGEKFATWDRDHDGALSVSEIDAAVADASVRGPSAAAAAALKRAARDPKLKLPALTLPYLREMAASPATAGKPDFVKMFAQGCERLGALSSRELFVGQPRLTTIHQGKLGNCFSLAPLGALVHRDPAEAAALIAPQKDGSFRVTFGKASASVSAPTDAEIALTSSNEDAGLWVNVYEKALGTCLNQAKPAEQRGGSPLDALARGGSAGTMLSYVTGHDIARITFTYAKDKNLADPGRAPQTAELRRQMTAAVAERRLMTCGTVTVTTPGLTPNHAYAILGFDEKSDIVELWNPHGDDFTPKGEAGLKFGYPKKDGIFRMPVTDWIAQFSGMAYELKPKSDAKSASSVNTQASAAMALKIVGEASTPEGARWTYEATDEGTEYRLSGVLFRPQGKGPFPAVVLSHGQGQTAEAYGAKLAAEMTKWGLVCIATNYTFAGQGKAVGAPGPADIRSCNPKDNVKRARKCLDLLASLGYVDMKRVAAHGHSMGAFLNVAIVGSFPERFKVASHTAGGEQPYNKDLSLLVRTPYSLHHGDADKSVALASDQRFDATLQKNGVAHELRIYPGMVHRDTAADSAVLAHLRDWYRQHGLIDGK